MDDLKHLTKADGAPKLILNVSPLELYQTGVRFNTAQTATLERYRFMECSALIENGTLKIWEYTRLPEYSYTTVSHVWDGAGTRPGDKTFEVQGEGEWAAGRTPINISVIQDACYAALKRNVNLLWVDRLCIVQSNKSDKKWHFKVMHEIYKRSAFCVVIPACLAQLTALNQETPWINRGWTLQEAVAPREVQVMFTWEGDETWVKPHMQAQVPYYITQITKGRSAMAPLGLILDCCISGSLILMDEQAKSMVKKVDGICIFGASPKGDGPSYKDASPSIAMLAAAISTLLEKDEDRVHHCLWKCMLMRATRYRADMIFSVMGLFGVTLNPDEFSENDCIKPAIALARELLKLKKPATWLGASFFAPPCSQLSTFPTFPRFTEGPTQKALIRDSQGFVAASSLMVNEFVGMDACLPEGDMDEDGYFNFNRMSVPVVLVTSNEAEGQDDTGHYMWGVSPEVWRIADLETEQRGKTFAVFLGFFCTYSPAPQLRENLMRAFIIEQHNPGSDKFHVRSYVMLTRAALNSFHIWERRYFSVGGPDPLDKKYVDEPLVEVKPLPKLFVVPDERYDTNAIVVQQPHALDPHAPLLDVVPVVMRSGVNMDEKSEGEPTLPAAEEPAPESSHISGSSWISNARSYPHTSLPRGGPQLFSLTGPTFTGNSGWRPKIGGAQMQESQARDRPQVLTSSGPTFIEKSGWKLIDDTWKDSEVSDFKQQFFRPGFR